MPQTATNLQDRIFQTISKKHWNQLEEAWLEVLEEEPQPLSFHAPIIERLIRKQDPTRFVDMYEEWLKNAIEKGSGSFALDVIDHIVAKYSQAEWLRPHMIGALKNYYADMPAERFEELMRESGLEDEDKNMITAYTRFRDLAGATKGQVFLHRSWGLGVVKDLDISTGKVIIDFDMKKRQTLTLEGVRNYLERIPPDHIRARIALEPDVLKEESLSEPGPVIRAALRSYGGKMKVSELKKLLTDRFMTDAEYKSFWNKAKPAIKLDPWIDQAGAGAHTELILRVEERSFFDNIFNELMLATNTSDRFYALRDVRRHGDDAEMTEKDKEALFQVYSKPILDGSLETDAEKLNHALLFEEFNDLFQDKENPIDIGELLRHENHMELLREVELHELRRMALKLLIDLYPDSWPEKFADLAISMDSRTATWMDRELKVREEDHYRQVAFENIIAKPQDNPDLFVWAAKQLLDGKWKTLTDTLPPILIIEELLALLGQLQDVVDDESVEDHSAEKNAGAKIRALINEKNAKHFKAAAAKCSVDEARRILKEIRLHNGLSHQMKAHMEGILVDAHEELRKQGRAEEAEEKAIAHHYTKEETLAAKRKELSTILSYEIPEAAQRIDAARELGDLKENAEYHAAKDYQKLLMQRAAELEDLISRARVVDNRDAAPDVSRFGTKITIKSGDVIRDVSILGIWEADPSQNIISYQTPFGSQLLGRRVGDKFTVTAQDGTKTDYECIAIESIL